MSIRNSFSAGDRKWSMSKRHVWSWYSMTIVRDGRSGVPMVPPYIGYLWAETHRYLHSEEDGKLPQMRRPAKKRLSERRGSETDSSGITSVMGSP